MIVPPWLFFAEPAFVPTLSCLTGRTIVSPSVLTSCDMLVALSFTDDEIVLSLAFDFNTESGSAPESILETCLFLISSSVFFHSALASFQ